ncbi:NAD(P)/FAD-dependent oxidoreductase [Parasphingorhabdus sp. JC815]|uniref:flavin monoamine oxidase family protein n=1 Tax=Parasphingorhabdus sp. JC815 TaxID=3232140 RepID=UPI0034591DA7
MTTFDHRNISRRTVLGGIAATTMLSACSIGTKKHDAEIIIIGAGLSGLYAANLLAEGGKDVLVLEGSDRIGGRLFTVESDHGLSEGGGEQVGGSYARIRYMADKLGIPISPYNAAPPATAIHKEGKLLAEKDWPGFSGNPFEGRARNLTPINALPVMAGSQNPLPDVSSWRKPEFAKYDISAADFLKSMGFDDAGIATIDHAFNANSVDDYSMLNAFRTGALFKQDRTLGETGYFVNGAQSLAKAMAKALPRSVETGQHIVRIDVGADGVEIESKDGKIWRAAQVVCSVPLPVLAKMAVNAPLSDVQKRAYNELPYTQIIQIHFQAKRPFWEEDGFGASMWSDGPLERLLARPGEDGKPDGVIRAWINGEGASKLNAKSDEELVQLCSEELKRMRPASEGKIDAFKIVRWTESNPLAGGAYMHYSPGQIGWAAGNVGASAGRLHFAGEHLSHLNLGMEGAMESGEQTAMHLLNNQG